MVRIQSVIPFAAVALVAAGCNIAFSAGHQAKLVGSGPITSDTRKVGSFREISMGANFDADVKVGSGPTLKIEAQPNILKHVVTRVKDNRLMVEYDVQNVSTNKMVKLIITTPSLKSIEVSGAAHANVTGVSGAQFAVSASGGSKLKFTGTADTFSAALSGGSDVLLDGLRSKKIAANLDGGATLMASGTSQGLNLALSGGSTFKGDRLQSSTVTVSSSGGATATVNASNALTVSANGASTVRYKGNARVTSSVNGASKVTRVP